MSRDEVGAFLLWVAVGSAVVALVDPRAMYVMCVAILVALAWEVVGNDSQ